MKHDSFGSRLATGRVPDRHPLARQQLLILSRDQRFCRGIVYSRWRSADGATSRGDMDRRHLRSTQSATSSRKGPTLGNWVDLAHAGSHMVASLRRGVPSFCFPLQARNSTRRHEHQSRPSDPESRHFHHHRVRGAVDPGRAGIVLTASGSKSTRLARLMQLPGSRCHGEVNRRFQGLQLTERQSSQSASTSLTFVGPSSTVVCHVRR